jgi:hypothetical protein
MTQTKRVVSILSYQAFEFAFDDMNMTLSQARDNTCGRMVVSTKENEPSSCSSYSAKTILNSVTAGYAAGSFGVLVGQPMDTAKVWLQTKGATPVSPAVPTTKSNAVANNVSTGLTRPSSSSSSLTTTSSSSAANNMSTLSVPQERGFNLRSIRALYSGVSGPLMTVGMIQSINFAIYDSLRRVLHRRTHPDAPDSAYLNTDSLAHVTVSAMVAGGVLACFTSPLLVIKTKQQIMEWNFQKAFLDTVRSSKKSILSSFYVGFGPHCVAAVCGRGIYFYSYETLKRTFLQNRKDGGEARTTMTVSLPERCVSAALSGILCWSIIFPFDALRSRMYAQALSSSSLTAKSSWEMAKSMYREQQSLRPFYRGFAVTVLRAGPVAATVLPIYDTTLEWLSRDE